MKKSSRFTKVMDEQIATDWVAGVQLREMGRRMSMDPDIVRARIYELRRQGWDVPPRRDPEVRSKDAVDAERLRKLRAEGMSPERAAVNLHRTLRWVVGRWATMDREDREAAAKTERHIPENMKRMKRKCLGHECGRTFMSSNAGERLCPLCKSKPTHAGFLRAYA